MDRFVTFAWDNLWLFIVFLVSGGVLAWTAARKATGARPLDPSAATALINREDAYVIDLRKPEEYRRGHLAGAVNVPFEELVGRIGSLPLERPLLLVDLGDRRIPAATRILAKAGAKNLSSLKGGILQWNNAGLPLV